MCKQKTSTKEQNETAKSKILTIIEGHFSSVELEFCLRSAFTVFKASQQSMLQLHMMHVHARKDTWFFVQFSDWFLIVIENKSARSQVMNKFLNSMLLSSQALPGHTWKNSCVCRVNSLCLDYVHPLTTMKLLYLHLLGYLLLGKTFPTYSNAIVNGSWLPHDLL